MDLLDVTAYCKNLGIALTGGVATGKSTVASLLRDEGELVIDADQLSRQVTEPGSPGLAAIRDAFGDHYVTQQGTLNRPALRDKIFADSAARKTLEGITHPLIQKALAEALTRAWKNQPPRRFFYEAALIFETGRDHLFREVWATMCPESTQLQRLMLRDHVPLNKAQAILSSQWPAIDKARKAHRAINTDMPLSDLRHMVKELLQKAPH